MPRYSVPLAAGVKTRLPYPGKSLQLVDTGAAASVVLEVEWSGDQQNTENFGALEDGDGIKGGAQTFGALSLTSTVDTTVDLLVSRNDVILVNGQSVDATIVNPLPVPVQADRGGAPATPFYVTGLTLDQTPAASMTDRAAVACTAVEAAIIAVDATRLEARFTNIGNDPVAIGKTGLTWAKRCVVLQPGDSWVETRGAAFAWVGITDTGGSASVTVQELKS